MIDFPCDERAHDTNHVLLCFDSFVPYNDVIMSAMASQITSLTTVYSTVYSGADQRKHQSSASLAFARGIHRWPVNSPHKGPVAPKMFPFGDVIMILANLVMSSNFNHTIVSVPVKQHLTPTRRNNITTMKTMKQCMINLRAYFVKHMMTSGRAKISCVTGPWWEVSPCHLWIPPSWGQ